MRLGQLIRAWRESHKLTVKVLAKQIGISAAALGLFEKGTKDPSWGTFLSIWEWSITPNPLQRLTPVKPTLLLTPNPIPDVVAVAHQFSEMVKSTAQPIGKQVPIPETPTPVDLGLGGAEGTQSK